MSGNVVDGLMISIGRAVWILPAGDLEAYRLPSDLARQLRRQLAEEDLVESDRPPTAMIGVQWNPNDQTAEFSSIMAHGLTASKVC